MEKKYIIPLLLCVIAFGSCKKDFLDKNPPTSVSTAIFWTSEADVQNAVSGVYSRLNENFLGYERIYMDGLSDNAFLIVNSFQSGMETVQTAGLSVGLSSLLGNFYNTPYRVIAQANYFIANIDKAPITTAKKDSATAEIRFLRALAYFDLVQNFGDVVLTTTIPATLDEAKIKQSPKAKVYELIEQDLDFAIANLRDARYAGHAVKGSAQALKAKVLLTQQKWSAAAPLLKQIIDNSAGKFALSNEYAGLFTTVGQAKPAVNIEIMFSTQYLAPNKVQRASNGMDLELAAYFIMQPYKDIVDEYEMTDGQSITTSPLYNAAAPYANRDPRLDQSVKLPGEKWLYGSGTEYVSPNTNLISTGFTMEKYVDRSRLPFTTTSGNSTDQDYIHLRYADVLLMYAEAQNEASGPDATVYKAINDVRSRTGVNMPPVDQALYNTKDKLREYIRHERRIEFAFEGQRYNDLKRWNIAHIKLPTMKNPNGVNFVFTQANYYMPFFQTELDTNKQLDQKDGYN